MNVPLMGALAIGAPWFMWRLHVAAHDARAVYRDARRAYRARRVQHFLDGYQVTGAGPVTL